MRAFSSISRVLLLQRQRTRALAMSTLSSTAAGTSSPSPRGVLESPEDVHLFWFGSGDLEGDPEYRGARMKLWFGGGDASCDFNVQQRNSAALIKEAAAGGPRWTDGGSKTLLSRIIVLDQFPRTAFRGTAAAFAYESLAADLVNSALDTGKDKVLALLLHKLDSDAVRAERKSGQFCCGA